MYQRVRGGYAILRVQGGSPLEPRLVPQPPGSSRRATVEVGVETFEVVAREDDVGHEPIWEKEKRDYPGIAGCEGRTTRWVPAIIFEPVS